MDDRRHELRREMDEHVCKFEGNIIEMSGDIKSLLAEFRTMNGSLLRAKERLQTHENDSVGFRKKVDLLWGGVHTAKWIIGLLLGAGIIWRFW